MDIQRKYSRALRLLAGLLVLLGACGDHYPTASPPTPPTPPTPQPAEPRQVVPGAILCTANLRAETVICGEGAPGTNAGLSIQMGYGRVRLLPGEVAFNSDTRTLHVPMGVQNLLAQPIGTPDGTTVTGLRVFFPTPPAATAGAGTVSVFNPDGTADISGGGQPYFAYEQLLRTREATSAKGWMFQVQPGVEAFEFQLLIDAEVPMPHGVMRWEQLTYKIVEGVWGSGSNTMFAVAGPRVLRTIDGGATWESQMVPGMSLHDIWGFGDSILYAVGNDDLGRGAVLRTEPGRWQEWTRVGSTARVLRVVWGSGPTDLYGISRNVTSPYIGAEGIFHSTDGSTWTEVQIPPVANLVVRDFGGIWGSGPNDVYVAGWEVVTNPGDARGVVLHSTDGGRTWDEHRFSRIGLHPYPDVRLSTVWGVGDGHVWVGGSGNFVGFIAHSTDHGATWTEARVAAPVADIWGTSPTEVYAVGANLGLYGFNGVSWFQYVTGAQQAGWSFSRVWGTNDGKVVIFGSNGLAFLGVR